MYYLRSSSFDRIASVSSVVVPCIALRHAHVDKCIVDPVCMFNIHCFYYPQCLMCHYLHAWITGTGFLLVSCSFRAFRITRDHRLLSGISDSPPVLLTDSECCNLSSVSPPVSLQPPRLPTLTRCAAYILSPVLSQYHYLHIVNLFLIPIYYDAIPYHMSSSFDSILSVSSVVEQLIALHHTYAPKPVLILVICFTYLVAISHSVLLYITCVYSLPE